jgi:hypothetical protein
MCQQQPWKPCISLDSSNTDTERYVVEVCNDHITHRANSESFVEYLLLLRGWCAGLRPPIICAKGSKAYNENTLRQD